MSTANVKRRFLIATLSLIAVQGTNLSLPGSNVAHAAKYRLADVENSLKELSNENDSIAKHAAFELGDMGIEAKMAIPKLTEILLSQRSDSLKGEAANTLSKIGPAAEQAIPALIQFLNSNSEPVERSYAAYALGQIAKQNEISIPALINAVQSDSDEVACQAAMALGNFGPDAQTAIPTLVNTIKNARKDLREYACNGLKDIPAKATYVPDLIVLLNDETDSAKIAAANSISGAGSEAVAAVPVLIRLLDDTNADIQKASASALGKIGPVAKEAVPALKKHLNDIDEASFSLEAIQKKHIERSDRNNSK